MRPCLPVLVEAILLLALALPYSLPVEASKLRTKQDDAGSNSGRPKKLRQFVTEKLISEYNNQPKKAAHSRNLQNEENSGVEEEEEEEEGRTVIVECSKPATFQCAGAGSKDDCATQVIEEQDQVWQKIQAHYPDATLVSSTQGLVNALYVNFPEKEDSTLIVDNVLLQMDGVQAVTPHGNLEMTGFGAAEYVGAYEAMKDLCVTGKDVRVAVLDSGIDYTHFYLGGPGTQEAYEAAYGQGPRSEENRVRDELFPTETVVDGFDFVGDWPGASGVPDLDPIDSLGHGTGK